MALTKPKLSQNIDTDISVFNDPILVLHQGSMSANVDTGFLFNRANGLVSNVAIFWSESANSFVTAFTTSSGITNTNVAPTQFANIRLGTATANVVQTDDYRYSNGAAFVSTTLANTTEIVANISSGQNVGLSLTTTGVVAGNYGSATSIPTIVVDSKGRITSLTANAVSTTINLAGTTGSGSVAGGGTLTVNGTSNQITTSVASSTVTIAFAQDIIAPGNVTVVGNLIVQGNTTTLNTETLVVEDLNITVANGAATAAAADGAGLTVSGANARLLYQAATDSWVFDKGVFASGNLVANSGTASSSTTTGALVVSGGAGIGGALHIGNTGDVSANIGTVRANLNTLDANLGTATTNIATLFSNAATQATSIDTINANLGTATTNITTLFSNAGAQATSINSINANLGTATTNINTLFSNAATQATSINTINANLGTATTNITTLFSNAATQATSINTINANIGAFGTYANTKIGTNTNSNLVVISTTTSTSTTTGALVVAGGVGIVGTLHAGELNINGAYRFPTADGIIGQVLTTNGAGIVTFANVAGGGGAGGFSQSTTTVYPTGDYGVGEESGVGTGGVATDAFEVPLGTLYDCMEPRGSIATVDLNT